MTTRTATVTATVTGAGGFVGGTIAAGLLALGVPVLAVDLSFDAAARARLQGATLVDADLSAGFPDIPRADLVIHAAALTTDAATLGITPAAHIRANMAPLLAALDHAAATRSGAFVFLSSTGVFAATDGTPDLTDTCPPTATHPYAAAKRAGELLTVSALDGLCPAHVVRLGYLYGPDETARPTRANLSLVARLLDAAVRGQPLMVPADDPRRDWTFAPDLAPALLRLTAAAPAGRPLHLTSGHVLPDTALARLIAQAHPGATVRTGPALGAKPPAVPSAMPALDGFAWTAPEAGLAALMSRRTAA
ncbi:MAG: NAD-dependent epimerase/dehydratase family protein [Rhodobacteraceae bacterium]|jgi:nucleoside-diphosphate-sugar epimerase|nr:NAD-dependent epimerase/dehydratase family protein [Paracoccaceae bacterium]